ncbi:hypothetical protein B0H19DRAFT_1138245 [Mycena capillaripes]|nr:hypothetical protein B0H19DRAFT_1138245 [Mycena capillaripes]
MVTELEVAKNQAIQSELGYKSEKMARLAAEDALRVADIACEDEKKARIVAEDALRKMKAEFEAREAKIRADEEEIQNYREAQEENLRRMQDTAVQHTQRLSSNDRHRERLAQPRPFPPDLSSLGEPPAKRPRVEDTTETCVLAVREVSATEGRRGARSAESPAPATTSSTALVTPARKLGPSSSPDSKDSSRPAAVRRSARKASASGGQTAATSDNKITTVEGSNIRFRFMPNISFG